MSAYLLVGDEFPLRMGGTTVRVIVTHSVDGGSYCDCEDGRAVFIPDSAIRPSADGSGFVAVNAEVV